MGWDLTMNVILVSLLVGKMWYDINQRFKDHNQIMEKAGVFGSDLSNFMNTIQIGHLVVNNNGPCNIQYVTNDDIASSNSLSHILMPSNIFIPL